MPRLLVMRADTLEREVELRGQSLQIGRNASNDIVLDDPGKSVSRHHAEIRFQGGRYVLADLESQNGIWVAGSRLPEIVLEPNVVATIGPFRLLLETSGDSAVVDAREVPGEDAGTVHKDGPALRGVPPGQHRITPRAGVSPASVLQQYRIPLIGGLAVAALAAGGFAWLRQPSSAPSVSYVDLLPEAERLITAGDCEGALRDIIEPALVQDPANAEAIRLEEEAQVCVAKPSAGPITEPPSQESTPSPSPVEVEAVLTALRTGDCAGARALWEGLLRATPDARSVQELQATVASCSPKVPGLAGSPTAKPVAVGGGPARELTPELGGLPVLPNENNDNYTARNQSILELLRKAETALAAGDLRQALVAFEEVQTMGTPRFRDPSSRNPSVGERIRELHGRKRDEATRHMTAAAAAEKRGEYRRALDELRRAREADSTVQIADTYTRIDKLRIDEGAKACQRVGLSLTFNNVKQAQADFPRVAELLGPEDPCFRELAPKIEALGPGPR